MRASKGVRGAGGVNFTSGGSSGLGDIHVFRLC